MLNEDGLPKLRINSYYRNILREKVQSSGAAKDYINEKIRSALWLIKSIHQRQRTIYRVTKSIVRFQRDFFGPGSHFLEAHGSQRCGRGRGDARIHHQPGDFQ